jgi:hypothetical protein
MKERTMSTIRNSQYADFLTGWAISLFVIALILSGCAGLVEQDPAVAATTTGDELPATAVAETDPPAAVTPVNTPQPSATPLPPASPTPTAVQATATATVVVPEPNPGWVWHEEPEVPGILFQLPQTWTDALWQAPGRYQSPETNSIVEVRAFDSSGNWLTWVQAHKQLAGSFVEQNGLVKGRPAFLFLESSPGSYTIELFIRDEARIINFFYQCGDFICLEEEMQILQTLFETIQFAAGNEGETNLPTGWVEGRVLTRYFPEQRAFTGESQTITGVVETWDTHPTVNEAILTGSDGRSYRLVLSDHDHFLGGQVAHQRWGADVPPLSRDIQPGQSLTVVGYPYPAGEAAGDSSRFYPLWAQTDGLAEEIPVFYRQFFDLNRFNPTVLAYYPVSTILYLYGPWEQVSQYLIDEPGNPLPDQVAALDPDTDVLVIGRLETTAPPRLAVGEFYYLDGSCKTVRSSVQQCQYYLPLSLTETSQDQAALAQNPTGAGDALLFARHDDLWLADISGGQVDQVTEDGFLNWGMDDEMGDWYHAYSYRRPHLSPNGRYLIHSRTGRDLLLVDLANRGAEPVAIPRPGAPLVAWSPDSQYVAYTPDTGVPAAQAGLYLYSLAGSEARRLLTAAEASDITELVWSPDGRFLAFACCFTPDDDTAGVERGTIHQLEIASGLLERVAETTRSVGGGTAQLCWTTGGIVAEKQGLVSTEIAHELARCSHERHGSTTLSPDRQYRSLLTPATADDHLWTGPSLLAVTAAETEELLWQQELTINASRIFWSADGQWLLLDNSQADAPIWRIPADGQGEVEMIVEAGFLVVVEPVVIPAR